MAKSPNCPTLNNWISLPGEVRLLCRFPSDQRQCHRSESDSDSDSETAGDHICPLCGCSHSRFCQSSGVYIQESHHLQGQRNIRCIAYKAGPTTDRTENRSGQRKSVKLMAEPCLLSNTGK